jgi:hypothetical protein
MPRARDSLSKFLKQDQRLWRHVRCDRVVVCASARCPSFPRCPQARNPQLPNPQLLGNPVLGACKGPPKCNCVAVCVLWFCRSIPAAFGRREVRFGRSSAEALRVAGSRHTLSSPARWATLRRDVWGCLRLLLRQSVEVGARERRGRRGEGAAIPDGAAAVVFSSEARTNGSSNTSFICYRCSSADCVRSSRGKRVIGVQPESDRR